MTSDSEHKEIVKRIILLTSIVCINSAILPLILSNTSALVTSWSAFEISVIADSHIECHNSSTCDQSNYGSGH